MTRFRTVPELFEIAVERSPSKEWLRFEDSGYTFLDAHAAIGAVAAGLAELGVGRATRVLASARNTPAYLFTWLASARLGSLLAAVNPASTEPELEGLLRQISPDVVVTDGDLLAGVQRSVRSAAPHARVALVDELVAGGGEPPPIAARADDAIVMIPTSGTTGRSKLVVQTQRAYALAGEGFPYWLRLTDDDRLMTSLPLFHVNAPAYSVMGSVAARAGLVLLPRFSASRFIEWSRRFGATEFNAIGAMLEILMRQPERENDADNPLRLCYTGPSPTKERQLEIERRFGFEIVCGYALSESPYGLIWRHGTRPYGTLGSARQHPTLGEINRARVVGESGEVGPGEVGELELKNPAVMLGYFDMPEETRRVLSDDGWLKTGDLVRLNADGTHTFVARRKEVIRRRGENLAPAEVEAALEQHPAVAESAVVGVPSDLSEEEVKAFVVLTEGADVPMSELRDFAADRLASFKVPRYLEVVAELPHTPTGRVAKHELPLERTAAEVDLAPEPARASGEGR